MKKRKYVLALIAIALFISSPCLAEWAINYGYWSTAAYSVQQTQDGGYIVAAGYGSLITKLNPDGNVDWHKEYILDYFCVARSIKQTRDGGYIVVGTAMHYRGGQLRDKIWILKLNADGIDEWQKEAYYEANPYHIARANSVTETFDREGPEGNPTGYILSGTTIHLTGQSWAGWVIRLNLDGTIDWQRTYGYPEETDFYIEQAFDQNGNADGYIAAGDTRYYGFDAYVLRLDLDGNVIWERIYGGSSTRAFSIKQTRDGGFIVAGTGADWGFAERHFWVAKLDSSGFIQWQKIYAGGGEDIAFSVEEVLDASGNPNGYAVAGRTRSGVANAWVLRLDLGGAIEWQKTYGTGYDEARSIQQTFNQADIPDGFVVAGGTGPDAFVLKLNANGEIPDCDIIDTRDVIVSDGSWFYYDNPPISVGQDSEATLIDTNVLLNEPDYPASVICYSEPVSLGDLDGNGCVDRNDYSIIMTDVRDEESNNPDHDLNGDGIVNIADARYLATLFTNPRGVACQ